MPHFRESAMTTDILELAANLRAQGQAFCLATVVRTVSVTAAKAGAKAVIDQTGTITEGWIGGGCARAAVLRAAREALADGQSRLVSITPAELLADRGLSPGQSRDGILYARNLCPSQGTMDIFVEPMLPRPALMILGASPVAVALATHAPRFGYDVTVAAPTEDHPRFPGCRVIAPAALDTPGFAEAASQSTPAPGFAPAPADTPAGRSETPARTAPHPFIVVATQGRGDEAALRQALATPAAYRGFVGSRRKIAALGQALGEPLSAVKCPAGLDLGAITPDEIALSILAELLSLRRQGQRG